MKHFWNKLNTVQFPGEHFGKVLILEVLLGMLAMAYLVYFGEPMLARDTIQYVELMKYYETHDKLPMVWYISCLPFILYRGAGMIPGLSTVDGMFLVNNLCFGLSSLFAGLIARKVLRSPEMALVTVLLYTFLPKVLAINASLLRESCGICFVLSALYCFLLALDSGKKRYFFITAFLGLAAGFCRIEFFELQPIAGLTMLILLCLKKWDLLDFVRKALCYAGGLICGLILIVTLLGGTWEEYKNIPDIIIFRCKASSELLERDTNVPDYYYY